MGAINDKNALPAPEAILKSIYGFVGINEDTIGQLNPLGEKIAADKPHPVFESEDPSSAPGS
jgi:hypothetical protein